MDFENFQPFRKNMNFLLFLFCGFGSGLTTPVEAGVITEMIAVVLATQHSSEFLCLCILLFYLRHYSLLFVLYLPPWPLWPSPSWQIPPSCHSASFCSFFYSRNVGRKHENRYRYTLTSKSQCFGSWSGGSVIKWLSGTLSGSEILLLQIPDPVPYYPS